MKMKRVNVGTIGLRVAYSIYGKECVISVGNFYTPATIEIPEQDEETFGILVSEEIIVSAGDALELTKE